MMMVSRYLRRALSSTARSECSGDASMASFTAHNQLEEFFKADRNPDEETPVVYGGEANNPNLDSMSKPVSDSKSKSDFDVQKLVDMFTKLNPLAKEFFPSITISSRLLTIRQTIEGSIWDEEDPAQPSTPAKKSIELGAGKEGMRMDGTKFRLFAHLTSRTSWNVVQRKAVLSKLCHSFCLRILEDIDTGLSMER